MLEQRGELEQRRRRREDGCAACMLHDCFGPTMFLLTTPGDDAWRLARLQAASQFGVALQRPAFGIPARAGIEDHVAWAEGGLIYEVGDLGFRHVWNLQTEPHVRMISAQRSQQLKI